MAVTRFPTRADGIADRVADFMAHLRLNGMSIGVAETEAALQAIGQVNALDMHETRLALKSICANNADRFEQFDPLFDAYWFNRGRERERTIEQDKKSFDKNRWSNRSLQDTAITSSSSGKQDLPDDDENGEGLGSGEGKLISSKNTNLQKTDLREFMKPEDIKKAELVAQQIARAIQRKRSRRYRAAQKGSIPDLRKIARKSVSSGGEPIRLVWRKRHHRPNHLVALLDVSGSMIAYSRVFLAFLKGLVGADQKTDAYLFHTRLVRISDALRDGDTFRAVNRLSMMAQGFGGGTRIGHNLETFNSQYASNTVNSRSVVIILSDGYDTDPPDRIANALKRLRKRGCRIIWLNPLKGWKDYEPVARGMAAALPLLDLFAPANTLDSLAALEGELVRLR